MAIAYRIYSNHGTAGPVDYSASVAGTAGLTYTTGSLGVSTDTTFVVRAYDPSTDLEEASAETCVRVVIGADGTDLSGVPNAPHALALAPAAGGGCRVSWAYAPASPLGTPTGFNVYLTQGSTVDYSSPAATVAYTPGGVGYSCMLPGPYALSTYAAAVRSFNATGADANTGSIAVTLGLPAPFAMEPVQVIDGPTGQQNLGDSRPPRVRPRHRPSGPLGEPHSANVVPSNEGMS